MSEIIEADRCDECQYYDASLIGVPRCGIDHIRIDDVTTVPTIRSCRQLTSKLSRPRRSGRGKRRRPTVGCSGLLGVGG